MRLWGLECQTASIFRIESTGKYRFAAKGMSKQKTLERRAEVTVIFSG
jgi:chemotaxis protein MotB